MPFLSTFGRLPGTWLNLLLVIIGSAFESFGLALFIPLLHIIGDQSINELPKPFSKIIKTFEDLGLDIGPFFLLTLIAGFSLFSLALSYMQRKLLIQTKESTSRDLRNALFNAHFESNWNASSQIAHGDIINQILTETTRATTGLMFELMAVGSAIMIVIYLLFSAIISWQLMAIAALFGGLIYIITRPFSKRSKYYGERTSQTVRSLTFICLEYMSCLKLLKATAHEEQAINSFAERNSNLFSALFLGELNTTRVNVMVQALPILMITALFGISIGVIELPSSLLLVFLLFMARTAPRVAQFQQQIQNYYRLMPGYQVILTSIETAQAARENKNHSGKIHTHLEHRIVLDNVSFKYPGEKSSAIKNVYLTIKRHQLVAVVGSSGAGKSTLMDLLIGLQKPDSGSITIDDVELSALNQDSWRRKLGIVTQDAAILNESLRDNLRFFNQTATDDDLAHAQKITRMDDIVKDLPDGMDTILGESGVRFSGGQKQRLALARALVGKPDFLLLDEATSALDNESERYIQDALNELAHTITIVVIAHRLSTVRRADMIYVMEDGQIIENGTYDELMGADGRFAKLRKLEIN